MAVPPRNNWRKFSQSQRAHSQQTQDEPERPVPPRKKTRIGTALQQRARELKLFPGVAGSTEPSEPTERTEATEAEGPAGADNSNRHSDGHSDGHIEAHIEAHTLNNGTNNGVTMEYDDAYDEAIDDDEAVNAAIDAEARRLGPQPSSMRRAQQPEISPLLSVGLLPPATLPETKDAIAFCLSALPTARTALDYAHGSARGQSPVTMRPPGHIRAPAAMMPQAEKLSISSASQQDSEGRQGSLYDPLTAAEASEPQYGTEPSLGPMGGFYDNTVKAFTPSGRQPAWVHQQYQNQEPQRGRGRGGGRGGFGGYNGCNGCNGYGGYGGYNEYNQSYHGQQTPPSKKRELPAHDTSSPSPAIALTPFTRLKLSSYLAEAVCSNGIANHLFPQELYEWQADCLGKDPGICGGLRKNLVVSAPTSSGKTLLAEILILRALGDDQQLLKQSRKALFVLPYVALCEEKAKRLQELIMPLSRQVKKAYGGEHSRQMWEPETGIIVCTPENANSMINRLIEEGTPIEDEICCFVVDELHLVGRDDRGTVLEMLLSKVAFLSKLIKHSNVDLSNLSHQEQNMTPTTPVTQSTLSDRFLQIVGLTATMPNIQEIGKWLNAVPYSCDFRPVPLREYLKEADGSVKLKQRTGRMTGGCCWLS